MKEMKERAYNKTSIKTYLDDTIEQNWTRSAVNEFNSILRAMSDGEIEFFSVPTIPLIYKDVDRLLGNIDEELSKEVILFEKIHSRQTAEGNMNDLRDILLSIKEYYEDAGFNIGSNVDDMVEYSARPAELSWKKKFTRKIAALF